MLKRRSPLPAAPEFFSVCLIWGLIIFVVLQLAVYSPATDHHAALLLPAAAEGEAVLPTQAAAAAAAAAEAGKADSVQPAVQKRLRLEPERYAGAALVVVTTTTAPYIEWTLNWSSHLKRLGVQHAVVALDPATVSALTQQGLPAVADASAQAQQLGLMTHQSVRQEYVHLRSLGYLRIGLPFQLMQQYGWQSLVLSDADVIWLKHPAGLLQQYPAAELMVSTDCLSVRALVERQPEVYRCGMQPGGWNSAWNTGVVVIRNTSAAVAAVSAWRDAMAPGSVSKSVEGWWIDDQLALTQLLDAESMPFQGLDDGQHASSQHAPGQPPPAAEAATNSSSNPFAAPTILAMKRQLQVVALSPLDIAGGHVALHQRLPDAYNVTPFAVHYTFQAKFDGAGKLSRARESNFWLRDPPEPPGSRYLTYANTVEAWLAEVDAVWQRHTGRRLAELHKHLLAAGYQLQVLAEALAAAHVLNRTLVPPRMVCYCTQDSAAWVDPLLTCAIAGSDALPPFACTLENLVNVVELQRSYEHVLKTPDFLKRPELQRLVAGSATVVKWVRSVEEAASPVPAPDLYTVQLLAAMQATAAAGAAAAWPVLPWQVSEAQLRQQLAAHAATAVLDFGALSPGWFLASCCTSPQLAGEVQQMVKDLTVYVGWCCLLEAEQGQNMDHAYVNYQKPLVPLSGQALRALSGAAAGGAGGAGGSAAAGLSSAADMPASQMSGHQGVWHPADELFVRPSWCGVDYLRPLNYNVSMRPQHPCHYLEGIVYDAALKQHVEGTLLRMHEPRLPQV